MNCKPNEPQEPHFPPRSTILIAYNLHRIHRPLEQDCQEPAALERRDQGKVRRNAFGLQNPSLLRTPLAAWDRGFDSLAPGGSTVARDAAEFAPLFAVVLLLPTVELASKFSQTLG
jgi:hypothetical protein